MRRAPSAVAKSAAAVGFMLTCLAGCGGEHGTAGKSTPTVTPSLTRTATATASATATSTGTATGAPPTATPTPIVATTGATATSTPAPTLAVGGCGAVCDYRLCSARCQDGKIHAGRCGLTLDTGCECEVECPSDCGIIIDSVPPTSNRPTIALTGNGSFVGYSEVNVEIDGGAQPVSFWFIPDHPFAVDVPLNPGLNQLRIYARASGPPGCYSEFHFDVVVTPETPTPTPPTTSTPTPSCGSGGTAPTCSPTQTPTCVCTPDPTPTMTPTPSIPTPTPTATTTPTPTGTGNCPPPAPTPRCELPLYFPACTVDQDGCPVCKCCFEAIPGCCDFGERRSCFAIEDSDSLLSCALYSDGGQPRGCPENVFCNETTGRCETFFPPTPAPSSPSTPASPTSTRTPCAECTLTATPTQSATPTHTPE